MKNKAKNKRIDCINIGKKINIVKEEPKKAKGIDTK